MGIVMSLSIGPLSLVKQVCHTVNLVQKNFVGVPCQRYIFDEILVK
ncbi:hypothetical protein SAMN06298224_0501 [Fibrobacter sp. UWB16]|nr:hypothetical protein SAMN06298224_0501 [Fibrobacter sp. UWB16]